MFSSFNLTDRILDAIFAGLTAAFLFIVLTFFRTQHFSIESLLLLKHMLAASACVGAVIGFLGGKRLLDRAIRSVWEDNFSTQTRVILIGIFLLVSWLIHTYAN
jgi:hypothetical protein